METLQVYYCPHCGHYGYCKDTSIHGGLCPLCETIMYPLDITCDKFIHLSQESRDILIIRDLLARETPVPDSIHAASQLYGHRCMSAVLISQIRQLSEENQKLNDTVQWMHRTIWELLDKCKDRLE